MTRELVTVPVAARFLGVPESHIKRKIRDGTFEVGERGSWNRPLIVFDDVKHYARAQQLGALGRKQLTVAIVGGDELDDAVLALQVSGLEIQREASIMLALVKHEVAGAPIIVASPDSVTHGLEALRQYGLLDELYGTMYLAVVSETPTSIPWVIERQAEVIEPWELRRLVQWAWRSLEARNYSGSLEL